MKDEKKRRLSVAIFAFYFSWLLAFLFEGRVFYALASRYQVDAYGMVFAALVSHFAGLALCGFFIHSILVARKFLMGSILFCIMGSFLFFFPPSILWQIGLSVMAFITGGAVSAWGYYYKRFTLPGDRLGTAAEGLIYSNLLMIVINMITSLFFDYAGFILSICMLLVAFFLVIRLPVESNMEGQYGIPELYLGERPWVQRRWCKRRRRDGNRTGGSAVRKANRRRPYRRLRLRFGACAGNHEFEEAADPGPPHGGFAQRAVRDRLVRHRARRNRFGEYDQVRSAPAREGRRLAQSRFFLVAVLPRGFGWTSRFQV